MKVLLILIVMGQEYRLPMTDQIECHEVQQAFWTLFPHDFAACYGEKE